ncbi:hypothetical protein HK099_007810 [Clydaea vesicula]|uniref:Uncharacterized protein n=1 Tax=Clydaea vesicula TaxID=447962 RepID=A0AAD5TWE1_9FUNG|nr:hypothetical protein HK099_007810 [Clydaea vesicula]
MNSSSSNETVVDYFGGTKLKCDTCYVKCSNEFEDLIYLDPLPFNKLKMSFSNCFCKNIDELFETYNLTMCNTYPASSVEICAKLVADDVEDYPPQSFIPQEKERKDLGSVPYVVLTIFSLLAAFLIMLKLEKNRKRTNQVFNPSLPSDVVIPLNERSLYYYQEEFGDEQLPKYCSDLEFQPSNEDIPLQVLNSDVINTTTTAGLPTFEESQVSTGQSIDQGETLNELQQNENIGNVTADSIILVPLSSNEQL